MNYVAANPNLPVCEDCVREFPEECMSYIFPTCCAFCAKTRLEAEAAERLLEAKYALLDDLEETTQIEADKLHKAEALDALYDSRVAS